MININNKIQNVNIMLNLNEINTITYIGNEIIDNKNVFYIRFYDNQGNDVLKKIDKWKFLTAKLDSKNNKKEIYQNIDFLSNRDIEICDIDIDIFQNLSLKEKLEYCDIIGGNLSDKLYRDIFLRRLLLYSDNLGNNFNLNKIWYLDIEVFRNFEYINPEPTNQNHFINSISIYSTVSNTLFLLLYENKNIIKDNITLSEKDLIDYIKEYANINIENVIINKFNFEVDLLNFFNDLIKKELPEVITGWNIFFDINFIIDRMNYLNFDKDNIFLNGYLEKENFNMGKIIKWYLPKFINIIDYLSIYKLYNKTKPEKFTLDDVSEFELGINKVEYDDTLDILYQNNIDLFIKYNIIDTIIVKLLDDKLKLIDFIFRLSQICLLPIYKFNFKNIGKIVEGVIFRYSKLKDDKENILWIKNSLLNRNKKKESEDEESYKGAFVKQPEKSGCFYYVSDLDATSLYPTIINNFNISPETFICKIEPIDNIYSNQEIIKIIRDNDIEKMNSILVYIYDFYNNKTKEPITLNDAIKIVKLFTKNFTITDNLSIFIFNKSSIYKDIVKDFKVKRKEAKNKQLKLMQLKEVLIS